MTGKKDKVENWKHTDSLSVMSWALSAATLAHAEEDTRTEDQVLASARVLAASKTCWPDASWSCLTDWATSRTADELMSSRWRDRMQGKCDSDVDAVAGACDDEDDDDAICEMVLTRVDQDSLEVVITP